MNTKISENLFLVLRRTQRGIKIEFVSFLGQKKKKKKAVVGHSKKKKEIHKDT